MTRRGTLLRSVVRRAERRVSLPRTDTGGGMPLTGDEAVTRALAAAAATAVDNARLHQQTRRQVRWIEATRDLVTDLLSDEETATVFQRLADTLRTLTDAALTFIALPDDEDPGTLTVLVASGPAAAEVVGSRLPTDGSTSGRAMRERVTLRVDELQYDPGELATHFGPALVAPLGSGATVTGVLVSLRPCGAEGFDDDMVDLVTSFADHAALCLSLAEGRLRERQVHVLADRDRIARDLHDHVIQRIFAAGLSLRATAERSDDPGVRSRLETTIDDLQDVIEDIRAAIFDLHSDSHPAVPLLTRIRTAVGELTADSGVVLSVRSSGPLSAVDPTTADHVCAVVRESVSNTVRHSGARRGVVTITVSDQIRVSVSDDGCGVTDIPSAAWHHGLRNMRARAEAVGGTLTVGRPPTGGTEIVWTAPLL